ncbi:MFS transporter [Streptomyces sp. NPDC050625]|uniref:MFS transporter n=1 Tax=Streptomyces sp. NPDC050625 TaxID=3154629 RepID=UPI0034144FDA
MAEGKIPPPKSNFRRERCHGTQKREGWTQDAMRGASVIRFGEFRVMCVSEFFSVAGEQFSRVALALLTFDRTGSAAITGMTYGLTYLPNVLGSLTLSVVGDRKPRRTVIIVIDAVRALAVAAMALPGMPLVVVCALVAMVSFLNGPYKATQLAFLRDVLDAEHYSAGMAVRQCVSQIGLLVGFAAGGVISSTSPQLCFAINAMTFTASAFSIGVLVRSRPVSTALQARSSLFDGLRIVWGSRGSRAIFVSTLTGVFLIAPEGAAAAYVDELGAKSEWVGFLLAGVAASSIVGLALFTRVVPYHRLPIAFPVVCLATGAPLPCVLLPVGPYLAGVIFGLSGALWTIQVTMSVSFLAEMLPDDRRAQGMGVAASMNFTASGVGAVLVGVVAQATSATSTIALAGVASMAFALWPCTIWARREKGASHGDKKPLHQEVAGIQ